MDPVDLSWNDLTEADANGDTLLSRWAGGSLDEAQERSVNLYLLSSTWAGDEARLHLAIHDGVREIAAGRSPVIEGLKIAVRAALGMLEVLEESLRPLQAAGVLTRTGEFRRPTEHTFPLDALHPGARLHVQMRAGRFSVDVARGDDDHDNAEWVLAGPGGTLVASDEEGASFPSVAPGTWLLHRRNGTTSGPVQLRLLSTD